MTGLDKVAPYQFSHVSGLCLLLANIAAHQTSVLLPAFDPSAALDAIERHGVTCVFTLPAMLALMADHQERRPRNIRSLRSLFAGGDSIPLTLQERAKTLFGLSVLEVMGMTEACPALWNTKATLPPRSSVGKTGVEIRIEPRGMDHSAVGELLFRGPSVSNGYWRDPERPDGWLHTGDLVRRDEDGYIWFEGRLKQIIIRGGSNISPQEVEAVLYRHPSVSQAGVIHRLSRCDSRADRRGIRSSSRRPRHLRSGTSRFRTRAHRGLQSAREYLDSARPSERPHWQDRPSRAGRNVASENCDRVRQPPGPAADGTRDNLDIPAVSSCINIYVRSRERSFRPANLAL